MYHRGMGVPKDIVQGHMWLNLAASGLSPDEKRDRAVRKREKIAESMTPAQIAQAQRGAAEWLEKHERKK